MVAERPEPPERVVTTGFARLTDGSKVAIGSRRDRCAGRRPRQRDAATRRPAARRQCERRTRSNERLRPLHPPADRDLAARRRGDAGRRARLLVAAGLGAAAGRFPDHPGDDAAAGRQSRHHRLAGDGAAGAAVRPDPRAADHDLVELLRHQPDHAAVRSQPRHRRRRAGRAVGDQCRRLDAAAQPSLSADLFQGESGRRADHHAGAHLADYRPARAERPRRHPDGAAAVRGDRRRPRLGAGRHPAGDPHPGRSVAARRLRHRAGGPAHRHRRRQCRRRQGLARRRAPVLHHRRQRPDRRRRRLQVRGRRLPQRRAGAAERRRRRGRRAGEHQGRRLVPGHSRRS